MTSQSAAPADSHGSNASGKHSLNANAAASTVSRIMSLDIIRGAVMVLMALDHVRVFAAVPANGLTPALFLTRWITNYCAPVFVFFAGTGAYLHAQKLGNMREMSKYLLVRGALLIFLEMTVSRLSWTFNLDFYNYTEANVIWAIGWSMIVLAALVHLPFKAIAAFGLIVVAGHNLSDPYSDQMYKALETSSIQGFWQVLYLLGDFRFFGNGPRLVVLYTLIPWVGVIAAGYAFGAVMNMQTARRRRFAYAIGLGAIALFVLLRATNAYGDPRPWPGSQPLHPVLAFINTAKYPASFLFLLMTLGPAIALVPPLENARGRLVRWLNVFGRVPLFYYLLHIPLIHAVAVLISLVRTPEATSWLFLNHPLRIPPAPAGYVWSLPMLYAVTLLVVIMLYFPCRWYARVKAERRDTWLSYL